MQTILQTVGALLDFARDFLVALPGLFHDLLLPVALPFFALGLLFGLKLAETFHNHFARRALRAARLSAEALKWKMEREGRERL